jgi:hypothetical protein
LEKTQYGSLKGFTKYIDRSGKILFMDNIDTGDEDTVLYFDYVKIYKKLLEMGLEYEQMKKLCVDMLYETHKKRCLL